VLHRLAEDYKVEISLGIEGVRNIVQVTQPCLWLTISAQKTEALLSRRGAVRWPRASRWW